MSLFRYIGAAYLQALCQAYGGHLAALETQEEGEFIIAYVQDQYGE
jgi:hypothetical protein